MENITKQMEITLEMPTRRRPTRGQQPKTIPARRRPSSMGTSKPNVAKRQTPPHPKKRSR